MIRHHGSLGIGTLLVVVGLFFGSQPRVHAVEEIEVRRLGGPTRVETSIEISLATFPERRYHVFLARSDRFPDALAAAFPAGVYGAPILLNPTDELHDAVRDELLRLEAEVVTIFGDYSAISLRVQQQIEALGVEVSRVAGPDRYGTASSAESYAAEQQRGTALVVTGTGFADALAVGPLAYDLNYPIILTTPDELHPEARDTFLRAGIQKAVIVGGRAAVSSEVEDQLEHVCFGSSDPNDPDGGPCVEVIDRIGGGDRTETAALVAEEFVGQLGVAPTHVNLARGDDFADAVAGSPHGGEGQAPTLLTVDRDTLGEAARGWLEKHADTIESIDVFGTTDAISEKVVEEARRAATSP